MNDSPLPIPAPRRQSKQVNVGRVAVGGGARIPVQTMTKTDTRDVAATVAQIREVAALGCDIVRCAVVDRAAAEALAEITAQVDIPVIADIHFDHTLALAAIASGVAGLRINPGNIGGAAKVAEVVRAARERAVPIRVGVNAGSLEKDVLARHGGATPAALVDSAMGHVRLLEDCGFDLIKISVKASDARRTVEAYRLLAACTGYPLHLGVTEAGTFVAGTVRSSVGIGILLAEGIGDTIRVSLTDHPAREVRVGLEILRALGLREPGPAVISCPTCGRTEVDVVQLASAVEAALERHYVEHPGAPRPVVAVMGCIVNGPGEAREADIALAGGRDKFALYVRGQHVASVSQADALPALMEQVASWHS